MNPQSDQLDEMDSNELAGPDEIVALEKRVDPETAAAVRRRGVDLRDISRARAPAIRRAGPRRSPRLLRILPSDARTAPSRALTPGLL